MTTLTVPRSLASQTNPTESQFDSMRTYLLNFFNTNNLDETNIAASSMVYTSLGDPVDDASFKWTSSHALMIYNGTLDYFKIENTQGPVVFGLRTGSTLTDYLKISSTNGDITVKGMLYMQTGIGDQTVSMFWMLAKYRKPRLEYTDDNIVTAELNGPSSTTSIVMMRDRVCTIVDRTCSLAATANGYVSNDTSTAVSGMADDASGVRTANRWVYIYAARVRYGSNADGASAILVGTSYGPIADNITTLNTMFGTGEWVYMGVVRNGYNDTVNTNIIVPFVYDQGGMIRFHQTTVTKNPTGITMASGTSTENLEYTTVFGNAAAATIPETVTRCIFGGFREAYGFEMMYRSTETDENHLIISGCYHTTGLSTLAPCLYMEVPLLEFYKVVIVTGAVETDQRITLAGMVDHYV